MRGFLCVCLLFVYGLCCPFMSAQVRAQDSGAPPARHIPGKHRGAVTAIAHNGNEIISAGEDGFIEVWNPGENAAVSRLQISAWRIEALALRAGTNELCVSERGEPDLYRVSAWNWAEGKKLFSVMRDDPVRYLDYSGGGSFIIAAARGSEGLALLDSQTGETKERFETLGGMAVFAATGRAERNMAVYLASGELLYLDLASKTETARFPAPAGIEKPVIFAGNRCLAGVSPQGLQLVDAASGAALDRDGGVSGASLLCPAGDGFYCLDGKTGELRLYGISRQGKLEVRERFALSGQGVLKGQEPVTAMSGGFAFGTGSGSVFTLQNGRLAEMAHNEQSRVAALAVSENSLALLTENGGLVFLPLDYRLFFEGMSAVHTKLKTGYDRILPLDGAENAAESGPRFLLWKNGAALAPAIIGAPTATGESGVPVPLDEIAVRFPPRSVSARGNKLLLLDSGGNLAVYNLTNRGKNRVFAMNAAGALDAAFINSSNIMLSRPSLSSNAPFLKVNIITGETVPLPYPALAGLYTRTGKSGATYGVAASHEGLKTKTAVLRLAPPGKWEEIASCPGEDDRVCIAESGGITAVSLGSEGAALYAEDAPVYFERGSGLPLALAGGASWFIALDSEGSICWHDNRSGKLLAVFRLYGERWMLEVGTEGKILRGALAD